MKLSQPIPILRILDQAKAREFYVNFLGFTIDWEYRFETNGPLYMQVSRAGCVFHLSEHQTDAPPGGALRIETDEVTAYNSELLQKQDKYAAPGVEETQWRTREMTIRDPFGNRLVFWEPIALSNVDVSAVNDPAMTAVGLTSRWVAASRALETESVDALYSDPFARELAGVTGFRMLSAMRAVMGAPDTQSADPFLTIRTKFLDDGLLGAVQNGEITQVVILAAGMDARAFRLEWPAGTTLFEVDRDDVFDQKEPILQRMNARPTCDRRVVRIDVSRSMTDPIVAAGFDARRPTAFLIEGLLMYLDEPSVVRVLESVSAIAAPRSWLGLDVVNSEMLTSTYMANYVQKLAEVGCPWHFGVADASVESFLAPFGWQARAVSPGEPDADYGRWRLPRMPRNVPGIPRVYFMSGVRS